MHNANGTQRLVGEVQILRIRVATAESKMKVLRDQARLAKRRRKEARRVAQRARKRFKEFKSDLSELQQALARAEAKFFQAGGRALARKIAKAGPFANRSVRPLKESRTVARPLRPAWPRESRVPGRVTRKKPAITEAKVVSDGPADVAALDPVASTPENRSLKS